MATAQLDAWTGVHRGAIDDITLRTGDALADVALARMMVHRRRAAVAEVAGEFGTLFGGRFAPYLDGRAPQVPVDARSETEAAGRARAIAESVCGPVPPLLFERAMLADMEGRTADALADFDRLLELYPGFLGAAVCAARVALAAGKPHQAVRWLVPVERELLHTREGAALMADALRAISQPEIASRYDAATLICPGFHDSRGNDIAPVGASGAIVADERMPVAFALEWTQDGRVLKNDRGLYYLVTPELSGFSLQRLLDAQGRRTRAILGRQLIGSLSALAELPEVVLVRLRILVWTRTPQWLPQALAAGMRQAAAYQAAAIRWIKRAIFRTVLTLLRPYRKLPVPVRAFVHRSAPEQPRKWALLYLGLAVESEKARVVSSVPVFELVERRQDRLQSGLGHIFRPQAANGGKKRPGDRAPESLDDAEAEIAEGREHEELPDPVARAAELAAAAAEIRQILDDLTSRVAAERNLPPRF